MKKIFTALAVVLTTVMLAQPAENVTQKREMMTAEQRAELQAKRLSLELDLNASQQAQIQKLLTAHLQEADQKRASHRQARAEGKTPTGMTADERYALQNERLDHQKAFQGEMKKILTPEQFDKWKEIRKDQRTKGKKRMAYRHRQNKKKNDGN